MEKRRMGGDLMDARDEIKRAAEKGEQARAATQMRAHEEEARQAMAAELAVAKRDFEVALEAKDAEREAALAEVKEQWEAAQGSKDEELATLRAELTTTLAQSGRLQSLLEEENAQLKAAAGALPPSWGKNLALFRTVALALCLALVTGTLLYSGFMIFTYRFWLFNAYAADQERFTPPS